MIRDAAVLAASPLPAANIATNTANSSPCGAFEESSGDDLAPDQHCRRRPKREARSQYPRSSSSRPDYAFGFASYGIPGERVEGPIKDR